MTVIQKEWYLTNDGFIVKDIQDVNTKCDHRNRYYQPYEEDTNTPESYTCEDCGVELYVPEIEDMI